MIPTPSRILAAAAITLALCTSAFAGPTTQTVGPANFDSYWYGNGFNPVTLGSINLAQGSSILDFSTQVTLVDQGWGNQGLGNGVRVELFNGNSAIWSEFVAGATHQWQTVNFDAAINDPSGLANLNTTLSGLWNTNPGNVDLGLVATPVGYPGWELHVRNASLTVTSSVPDSGSALMLLSIGLVCLVSVRRKRAS